MSREPPSIEDAITTLLDALSAARTRAEYNTLADARTGLHLRRHRAFERGRAQAFLSALQLVELHLYQFMPPTAKGTYLPWPPITRTNQSTTVSAATPSPSKSTATKSTTP